MADGLQASWLGSLGTFISTFSTFYLREKGFFLVLGKEESEKKKKRKKIKGNREMQKGKRKKEKNKKEKEKENGRRTSQGLTRVIWTV